MSRTCPICEHTITDVKNTEGFTYVNCEKVCGKYALTHEVMDHIELKQRITNPDERLKVSHYIAKAQGKDDLKINITLIDTILKENLPTLDEQVENLIVWMGKNTEPGGEIKIDQLPHHYVIGSKSKDGLWFVVRHLLARDYLISNNVKKVEVLSPDKIKLSFEGWKKYEEAKKGHGDSMKAFMAMKFGDPTLDKLVENYFRKAVADTGFLLRRLDDNPKPGLIDDKMRVDIQTSKFLISDLTHDNLGAYWEAGYAEGLGKVVIYTCEKEKFRKDKSHFDTNHHLTILWDSSDSEKAAEELKATIRAAFPHLAKMDDS